MSRSLQISLSIIAAFVGIASASALPPLGLTEINTGFNRLEIIDGTAYISGRFEIQTVSSSGNLDSVAISHPVFGPVDGVTRVVKATDGDLYFAANFSLNSNFEAGAALFELSQPSVPIVTWQGSSASGVDSTLRTFGNIPDGNGFEEAGRLLLSGATEALPHPTGIPNFNNGTSLSDATPSGYALGDAGIPGTAGSAPAIWSPSGEFSFVAPSAYSTSIRDRLDGSGVNLGWNDGRDPVIKYGVKSPISVFNELGGFLGSENFALVSQSDFAVILEDVNYAFYPGIIPNHPDRAVPLLDIFPELATIDIDFISDLASVDGYLYMTLSGDDGTFLFGARDPSVVPEPASVLIMLLGAFALVSRLTRG